MRKIPTLLLSALMLSTLLYQGKPVSAAMEENGTTWWTVEELLDFYPEVEAEKNAKCGDDEWCKTDFIFGLYEKGGKYSALKNLIDNQIWITSVNPATETIKVLYFDRDMIFGHTGIDEEIHLRHLYIGWMENWNGQIYNYDHERFTNGSMIGNHPMYEGSSFIDGPDWIPAWEEVELSVANSNLVDNTHGKIDYAVYAENNMYNAQGYFDISTCLNSPDYEIGTECKMYVSGDQWVSYFPPRESIIEPNNNIVTEPIDATEPNNDGTGLIDTTWPDTNTDLEPINNSDAINISTQQELVVEEENGVRPILMVPNNSLASPKTPETGQNTGNREYSTEMPWWITMLSTIGLLLILWWFLPTKNEIIRKKVEKNRKKVLTKKAGCDKMVSV